MHLQKVGVFEKPLPSVMPQGLKASDFVNFYQSAQSPNAKGLKVSGTHIGHIGARKSSFGSRHLSRCVDLTGMGQLQISRYFHLMVTVRRFQIQSKNPISRNFKAFKRSEKPVDLS
jgi:hypothetical protein